MGKFIPKLTVLFISLTVLSGCLGGENNSDTDSKISDNSKNENLAQNALNKNSLSGNSYTVNSVEKTGDAGTSIDTNSSSPILRNSGDITNNTSVSNTSPAGDVSVKNSLTKTEVPAPKKQVPPDVSTPINAEKNLYWNGYTNDYMAIAIKVPERVLKNSKDPSSLTALNIFDDRDNVYFTTDTFKDTLKNKSWHFRISGTTIKDKNEILDYLENLYTLQGCKISFSEDKNTGYETVILTSTVPLCSFNGDIKTIYDKSTGKIISYKTTGDQFFTVPGGNVTAESLASLKFNP